MPLGIEELDSAQSFSRTPSHASLARAGLSADRARSPGAASLGASVPVVVGFKPAPRASASGNSGRFAAPVEAPLGGSLHGSLSGHLPGLSAGADVDAGRTFQSPPVPRIPRADPAADVEARARSLLRGLAQRHPVLREAVFGRAFEAALRAVRGREADGQPVIVAALNGAVATLCDLGLDADVLAAGVLSSALAHVSPVRADEVLADFSDDLAATVTNARRMSSILDLEGATAESEELRDVLLSMGDVRASVIHLAQALQDLRGLSHREAGERRRVARAHMETLVPLASRIGLASVKSEMEDLCFYHLDPVTHAKLRSRFHTQERRQALQQALDRTEAALKESGIEVVDIAGRVKSLFGIHRKTHSKSLGLDDVLDAQALRVIVPTKVDCYSALRVVQETFRPLESIGLRFKDYIRESKGNGYRSLHCYIECPGGVPAEVQIRTADMHVVSEYGAAAHWRYKESLGADGLGQCSEKLVAYAKYVLGWELDVHDAKCKPQSPGTSAGAAGAPGGLVRETGALCTFPEHAEACNHRDERFCGSLEDLRSTACATCGAAHVVFVGLDGRVRVLRTQAGTSLAEALAADSGLAGRFFDVNGAVLDGTAAAAFEVRSGDLVLELAPAQARALRERQASESEAAREREPPAGEPAPVGETPRVEVSVKISALGISQVTVATDVGVVASPKPAPSPGAPAPELAARAVAGQASSSARELDAGFGPFSSEGGSGRAGVSAAAALTAAAVTRGALRSGSSGQLRQAFGSLVSSARESRSPGTSPRASSGRSGREAGSGRAEAEGVHPVVVGFGSGSTVLHSHPLPGSPRTTDPAVLLSRWEGPSPAGRLVM